MSKALYPPRNYALGQALFTLRSRTKLTQTEFAARIGLHRRSIQKWESGETYPTAENLRALLALLVDVAVFTADQERAEAAALWEQVSEEAPQPLPRFDTAWFDQLLTKRTQGKLDQTPTVARPTPIAAPALSATTQPPMPFNLPFHPLPLLGRDAELNEINRILNEPTCRLLTLIGPGGVGKTRLTVEVARRQAETFRDGVAFVSLTSVNTPSQIVAAIGAALNLAFAEQANLAAHLLAYLRTRHLLLILDDFEHLLEGVDLVQALLQAAPQLTMLITSRMRLNLQAEWLFDLTGLAYPPVDAQNLGRTQNATTLASYSAVQLFVQRATQIQPNFTLSATNLVPIVQICQFVAGMPLAIELAAANVRFLPLPEIERQIRSNLDVLATTLRDVPARHRSLRAVFDQSWQLLNPPEQLLFRRLAVLRGQWTAAAAQQVAQATLPRLAALVDKSLVEQVRVTPDAQHLPGVNEPELCFALLEPLREYALEQLAASGEAEPLRRAHAAYYLALAEAAAVQTGSIAEDAAFKQLYVEQNNLRAALQWARDGGDLLLGLQLAGALWRFWRGNGISEGRAWLEELLALDKLQPSPVRAAARLRATQVAAWLASDQNDFARAAQLFEESSALHAALHKTPSQSASETNLLINAARQARAGGQYGRATKLLEAGLAQHRATGDQGSIRNAGLGQALYELALVLREQGDFTRAALLYEECIKLHQMLGDREGMAQGLLGLGDVARDQGDGNSVRRYNEESLAIFREFGAQWAVGFSLHNLALAAYWAGDLSQAYAFAQESATIFRAQKANASLDEVLVTLGQILKAQGDPGAYATLTEAFRLAAVVGPRLVMTAALEALGCLAIASGQAPLAVQLLAAATHLRTQMGAPVRPADQASVTRAVATTRSTLGAATFTTLWAKGETLTVEQILNLLPDEATFLPLQPQ